MLPRAHHPSLPPRTRRSLALAALALVLLIPARACAAEPAAYAPNEILVKYANATAPLARAATAHAARAVGYPINLAPHTRLLHLAHGVSVTSALSRLRGAA